ncbi:MAG: Protein of unknown function bacterial [Deltaproteobacteria bacterium]|nr:Protein of unknown function bacterial [Deltaproteobacteria bacterium]
MGILDDHLGNVLGEQGENVSPQQGAGLTQAILNLLNDPRVGGIEGRPQSFQQGDLGDIFRSWISTGKNLPVSAEQILQALAHGQVEQLSQKAGLSASQGPSVLAQLLPLFIDRLTPDGTVPQQNQLADAGMKLLTQLLA